MLWHGYTTEGTIKKLQIPDLPPKWPRNKIKPQEKVLSLRNLHKFSVEIFQGLRKAVVLPETKTNVN